MKKWKFVVGVLVMAAIFFVAFAPMEEPSYSDCEDGVYIGEGEGIRKHLKVQVVLDGGYITKVEVIEHYEKGAYHYEAPISQIPDEIVKKQSPDVDAVSGSTLTSNGIMDAVRDALEQARQ